MHRLGFFDLHLIFNESKLELYTNNWAEKLAFCQISGTIDNQDE
jgi:hypothetical protein